LELDRATEVHTDLTESYTHRATHTELPQNYTHSYTQLHTATHNYTHSYTQLHTELSSVCSYTDRATSQKTMFCY